MPPMEQLRYKPLDHESGTIRLVRLLPDKDEPIRLELISSNLDEEPHIPYEALSYVWGSPNKGQAVEVDGQQLTIRRNLILALLSLRHANEDRILWIDAICINQSDNEEKREQVAKMATIFARAERLIIWLGESTPETDMVFHSMQRLEKEAQKHPYKSWEPSDKRWLELWSTVGNADEDPVLQQRKGLESILSRPWFKRIWFIPEVVNARSAEVACGLKAVSSPIFVVTPSLLGVTPDSHCQAIMDIMPGPGRKYSWWAKDPDFSTILLKFKGGQAANPRDRIYALLGLCRDERTEVLHPDYTKSPAEVIQDTVAALLRIDDGWKSTCLLPEWDLSEFYKNLPSLVDTVSRWAIKEGQTTTLETIMHRNNVHVVGDSFGPESLLWEAIVHRRIELASEASRQAKTSELEKWWSNFDEHSLGISGGTCTCTFKQDGTRDVRGCIKCWHWRARNRMHPRTAIVQLLLEMGADVDFRNEVSCEALVFAVWNGHRQTVKLLLERFTKVDRIGDDYNNILRQADLRELIPEAGNNSHVLRRKNIDGSQVTSADDSISSTKNSHTYVNSTSDREEWDNMTKVNLGESHRVLDTRAQQQKFQDVDVQSLVSEEGDTASSASMPLPSWASETELIIIGAFAKSSVLSPLYSKALQLMPEERFINNFRRLLKAFHGNLVASDNSNITRQLAKLLRSKQRQSRIARMIIARHVAPQSSWNEEELANLRDQEKQAYTNVERWLDRTIVSSTVIDTQAVRSEIPGKEYESDDDSDSESDEEKNTSDVAQYPRLDLVVQKLVEGQPFQDMLASFKELLLPPGLLKELLPIPRDNITYGTTEETGLLSTVQGFLEEITALEWDWWPLSPRMRPLKPCETRVHWKCFCGANRWRELKLEQQEILIEVLKESSADHHPRPLCALLQNTKNTSCTKTSGPSRNPRVRSAREIFELGLMSNAIAFGCWYVELNIVWVYWFFTIACFVGAIVVSQDPTSRPNQKATPGAHRSAKSIGSVLSVETQAMRSQPGSDAASQAGGNGPVQPTSASSSSSQTSSGNNSAYNKQLWVNFGADGSWTSTELDQLGGLHLVSDAAFLRNLGRRHREIRGWFRHYFSFRIISYWEFLRFKRLPLLPPQTIDVEADLPTSSDYEYDPRPPLATRDKPGITKHEFEVYVRLCLDPCWLSSLLIPHKCRTVEDSAVDIVDKIPKYKKLLEQRTQGDEHVWGIRARYVVSGIRVVALHIAILCVSFGVWIWWQWKHPDDLQGAAVALTAAFLLISTFWSATGVLRDLR